MGIVAVVVVVVASGGGIRFYIHGTVTWLYTYAPPGRGPGLAELLLTSETPSAAPPNPGPCRSPPDLRRRPLGAPVGHSAPESGSPVFWFRASAPDTLFSVRLYF